MSDSVVKCDKCGSRQNVDFAVCLRKGWPMCCKYTMRLISRPTDLDRAVRMALGGTHT